MAVARPPPVTVPPGCMPGPARSQARAALKQLNLKTLLFLLTLPLRRDT